MKRTECLLFLLFIFLITPVKVFSVKDTTASEYKLIGDSLYNNKNYQDAIVMFNKSVQLASSQKEPNLYEIANCKRNMGICYFHEKNCKEAIPSFEESLELDFQLNNKNGVADDLYYLGLSYKKLGVYDKAVDYYNQALLMDENSGDSIKIYQSLNSIGALYDEWSRIDKAIEYYERSLKIKEALNDSVAIGITISNISDLYQDWGKIDQALEYMQEALRIAKESGNKSDEAKRLNKLGDIYKSMSEHDKALEYYNEALDIYMKIVDAEGIADVYNNIGFLYKKTKEYDNAINYLELALVKYRSLNFKGKISIVLYNIGDIFLERGDIVNAEKYFTESLEMTKEQGNLKGTLANYKKLSKLYDEKGDCDKAFNYYKKFSQIKDTLFNAEKHRQITGFQIRYETEKKDKEIQLMKQKDVIQKLDLKKQKILRNSFILGFIFVLILAGIIFYGLIQKRRSTKIIEAEKLKSDELLHNILPAKVASDLKKKGATDPQLFENVTILFSDIINFTERSNELEPKVLINELNDIFTNFDNIIERNHGERIKTIGDAYLAVCGLPESDPKHADNIVNAAMKIIDYLKERNKTARHKWEIRVGIHSGQVVGGVVGVKKYIYDVFGDAINTASRMEANSAPMRVNVSQTTMELVKYRFEFEDRGDIETKGKGRIKMYFLKGPKGNLKV